MKSEYRRLDRETVWHPYTDYRELMSEDFPVIEAGEGIHLYDVEGKQYVDAISSWWACNLGHGQKQVVEAIKNQADELQHSILGNQSNPRAIELAQRLVEKNGGNRRAFFASDGASAVEAALKIALQHWHNRGDNKRRKIAYLKGDYHGDTLGAVSVGYLEGFHKPFKAVLPDQPSLPSPDCLSCEEAEVSCSLKCYDDVSALLSQEGEELAAVVIEPLCQAAMGMNIYPARFLRRLALQCREKGILLIDDEIAMGMGRTGKMWAYEQADIRPDIICLGKGLTAGYLPLSTTLVDENIYDSFKSPPPERTFFHGHTFAGNPLASAAALATLDYYDENDLLVHVQSLAELVAEQFEQMEDVSSVKTARSLGLLGTVQLDGADRDEAVHRAKRVKHELLRRGVLVRPLGPVVYLMPPLVIEEEQLVDLIEEFKSVIEKVGDG